MLKSCRSQTVCLRSPFRSSRRIPCLYPIAAWLVCFVFVGSANAEAAADDFGGEDDDAWDDRYWKEELLRRPVFEWYGMPWSHVRQLVPASVSRVLHVGVGTSAWPEAMAEESALEVIHVDNSAVLVEELRKRYPALSFVHADGRSLPFKNESFDMVVEKGMLDGILFSGLEGALASVREMYRVLRAGGVLLSLTSFGGPGETGPFLGEADWESQQFVDLRSLPRATPNTPPPETDHYVGAYLCTKAATVPSDESGPTRMEEL
eukprot:TRINITY_DN103748_c0_g1_i1.p1 TRINITY_DN103748_c0_g1~~TRINITY_DN103748_c0_g1_i1.p1  ORF type:complete len:263 (+),score=44.08 TRINITY_DN103748_c0_g1_i1:135-923(+)